MSRRKPRFSLSRWRLPLLIGQWTFWGFLGLTLLALNFLGDGLRDAVDPKGKRA